MLTLADVFEALTCTRPACTDAPFSEVTAASLHALPGALYVALPGQHADGHIHIGDAFHHGARAALIQHDLSHLFPVIDLRDGVLPDPLVIPAAPFCLRVPETLQALGKIALFWRNKSQLRTLAITGSVQRTMTQELVADVLGQRYRTLNFSSGSMPEEQLYLSLLKMSGKHDRAVLEIDPLSPLPSPRIIDLFQPSIAILTDAGSEQRGDANFHASITRSAQTLLQALPSAPQGVAVLKDGDLALHELAKQTSATPFFYGLDSDADLWADEIESQGAEGIRFRLHFHNESLYLRIPLLGRHSVHTALQAAAAGLLEDLTWHDIATGLKMSHAQLRLLTVDTPTGAVILDDTYSASPESTLAALNLLNEMHARKVAVLGELGDLEPDQDDMNTLVGVRAAEVVNELVTVGEEAQSIAQAAKQAGLAAQAITWAKNTQEAVDHLLNGLHFGDVVLIKGAHDALMDRIVSALAVAS